MTHCASIRRFLCVCLGVALGYQLSFAFGTQPNIVFILSDDAAYSNFGFSAALNNRTTQFETPNLDALAQRSVVGSQFYVGHSLCGPSRYDLLTGLYSQRQGYENNIADWGVFAVNGNITQGVTPDVTMLPQRLKSLGYSTGMIGKWHEGYQEGLNTPMDKGFDEFFGFDGGGRSYWGYGGTDPDHGMVKNNQYYESQWQTEGDHSAYDPTHGRYVTDAFGDEAVGFVNRHATDSNPFFLYLPINAPHEPYDVKQSDLDHFANITDPNTRTLAAMTYAMDRSVGKVLNALQANGIDDNTIVVFANDNGAPSFVGSPPNPPFQGNKGTMYEGGIRTPFMIKGPGLTPGVYNSPITALDMVPTLVAAAGGDISQFQHDGYDVMPYLDGQATDDPNKVRFWRNFNCYAVRKGDWKLTIMYQNYTGQALFNIATDPGERTFLNGQHPDIIADLQNELTLWEATLEKPKWGDVGAWNQNLFDHFVYRSDLAATSNWSAASMWTQSGTTNNATLNPADAYANAVIEFTVRNDADYTANNDMLRMSRQTFMLNQLQLTGDFSGTANRRGTIGGNAVLMVKDLRGQLPQIRLDATGGTTGAGFTFAIGNEIQLLDDLQITGNGTQQFLLTGSLRDYYQPFAPTQYKHPHNVTKTGTSQLVLTGNSTFGGTFAINGGQVRVNGATAAINGPAMISIASGAMLALDNGSITVPTIDNAAGGIAVLYGGILKAPNITGNLINLGGTLAPGTTPAIRTIGGSLYENAGTLQMLINSASSFDRLQVGSTADIGGTLSVQLGNGYSPALNQTFQFLTAASGITGTFTNLVLPGLSAGKTWQVFYGANDVRLTVSAIVGITGDYNQNGIVDAGDYLIWRKSLGSTTNLAADGNHNGIIDNSDYTLWRQRLGATSGGVGSGSSSVVPEPSTVVSLLIAGSSMFPRRRRVG